MEHVLARSMLYSMALISLSPDKLWAGYKLSGAPWDDSEYAIMDEYHRNWNEASTRKIVNNVLKPQARVGHDVSWGSNVWSALLGAVFGAGSVLIIAALLYVFKRPKKTEQQSIAPIEVGQNVST
ncbi:unnamed protein product [Colias eurytheme]|nr:unnamed protein product [Colias eurytheme]